MTQSPINLNEFNTLCTGDVVAGDTIFFSEAVFEGPYRKAKYVGDRKVVAEIIKDSYGKAKQQHTFTLKVLWSKGPQELPVGKKIRRKGRVIYRNGTLRQRWENEEAREAALEEKHFRGDMAREQRACRKAVWG